MTEGAQELNNSSSPQERLSNKPGFIRFEPGNHGSGSHGRNILEKINAGDLNSHVWNGEVSDRLRDYKPYVIGIDSLYPHAEDIDPLKYDIDLDGKKRIWQWLPNDPMRINDKGEVLVVSGDIQYGLMADEFPPTLDEAQAEEINRRLSSERRKQMGMEPYKKERNLLFGGTVLLDAISIATLIYAANKDKQMSRRKFLQNAGMAGVMATLAPAGLIAGRYLGTTAAMYAPNEEVAGVLKNISKLTAPFIYKDDWIDARTALVIAKTKEAAESELVQSGSNAAVVFGNGHTFESEKLLHSVEERAKVIRKLANTMSGVIRDISQEFNVFAPSIATNIFLDLMAKSEYAIVSSPKKAQGAEPLDKLQNSINYIGYKQCFEVENALEPLRSQEFAKK